MKPAANCNFSNELLHAGMAPGFRWNFGIMEIGDGFFKYLLDRSVVIENDVILFYLALSLSLSSLLRNTI